MVETTQIYPMSPSPDPWAFFQSLNLPVYQYLDEIVLPKGLPSDKLYKVWKTAIVSQIWQVIERKEKNPYNPNYPVVALPFDPQQKRFWLVVDCDIQKRLVGKSVLVLMKFFPHALFWQQTISGGFHAFYEISSELNTKFSGNAGIKFSPQLTDFPIPVQEAVDHIEIYRNQRHLFMMAPSQCDRGKYFMYANPGAKMITKEEDLPNWLVVALKDKFLQTVEKDKKPESRPNAPVQPVPVVDFESSIGEISHDIRLPPGGIALFEGTFQINHLEGLTPQPQGSLPQMEMKYWKYMFGEFYYVLNLRSESEIMQAFDLMGSKQREYKRAVCLSQVRNLLKSKKFYRFGYAKYKELFGELTSSQVLQYFPNPVDVELDIALSLLENLQDSAPVYCANWKKWGFWRDYTWTWGEENESRVRDLILNYQQQRSGNTKIRFINNVLEYLKIRRTINSDEIEARQDLLLFKNGVYDLKNKVFRKSDPSFLNQNAYDFDFIPNQDRPSIVTKYFEGTGWSPTEILRVEQILAAFVKHELVQKKFLLISYGCPGSGKTLLANLAGSMAGKEAGITSSGFNTIGENKFEAGSFEKKRLVVFDELSCTMIDPVTLAWLKLHTGGPMKISIGKKYEQDHPVDLFYTIWICTNELFTFPPSVDTKALYNRIWFLYYNKENEPSEAFEQEFKSTATIQKYLSYLLKFPSTSVFSLPKLPDHARAIIKGETPLSELTVDCFWEKETNLLAEWFSTNFEIYDCKLGLHEPIGCSTLSAEATDWIKRKNHSVSGLKKSLDILVSQAGGRKAHVPFPDGSKPFCWTNIRRKKPRTMAISDFIDQMFSHNTYRRYTWPVKDIGLALRAGGYPDSEHAKLIKGLIDSGHIFQPTPELYELVLKPNITIK